jgi:hypothetical protein
MSGPLNRFRWPRRNAGKAIISWPEADAVVREAWLILSRVWCFDAMAPTPVQGPNRRFG